MGNEMTTNRRLTRGFTLIELVVVMVIAALAAAMLIRTTIKVRGRMGEVSCQGNMRQLLSALQMYNNDHNGSMPYGWYYVNSHPVTWQQVGTSGVQVTWVGELNRYFNTKGYADAFRCPTAIQQAPPHLNSYVMNFVVGVSPLDELRVGERPGAQTKPPKLHLMLREGTALIWDTGIRPNWQNLLGHLTGADIDDQRFWQGARTPQYRYFSPHDPFGSLPPAVLGNNRPVQLDVGGSTYYNNDPGTSAN